jgi:sugar-specific transcriptional regulator TrmB
MAFEDEINRVSTMLQSMGLNEYQASALSYLFLLGETKATALSKASGVPPARIYDVLNDLVKMGLVTVRPGRPSLYTARSPKEAVSLLMAQQRENLRRTLRRLEDQASDFIDAAESLYLKGADAAPTVPLLRIVTVGSVSLEETRNVYDSAEKEILILSKAMEYFPDVRENLERAKKRGVSTRIIMMSPESMRPEEREKQAEILEALNATLGKKVSLRFSQEIPIRGSIVDPDVGGRAIFLVEDPGVPFFLREAAITSHNSVVKGLALMFDLLWEYRSKQLDWDRLEVANHSLE